MTMRPRLGFLGLGHIGRMRLEALVAADLADVVAVADSSRNACAAAHLLAPSAVVGACLDDVLATDVDGIVLATPSALHAEQAMTALSAGAAVFCQKPLARTGEETRAVLRAARSADRLLGVDLCYRHTQAMRCVDDLLQSGTLGNIYAAEFVFHNAYGPDKGWFYDRSQSGGGCLIDLGTHLVDLMLWTMGDWIEAIDGRLFSGGDRLDAPAECIEDFAVVRADFSSGAMATISCSWRLPAGRDAVIDCRWFGTRGGTRFANVNGSFFDFVAERFDGTRTEQLCAPPDDWGGRALIDWTRRLRDDGRYDRDAEGLVRIADVLDAAYGRPGEVAAERARDGGVASA